MSSGRQGEEGSTSCTNKMAAVSPASRTISLTGTGNHQLNKYPDVGKSVFGQMPWGGREASGERTGGEATGVLMISILFRRFFFLRFYSRQFPISRIVSLYIISFYAVLYFVILFIYFFSSAFIPDNSLFPAWCLCILFPFIVLFILCNTFDTFLSLLFTMYVYPQILDLVSCCEYTLNGSFVQTITAIER